MTMLTLPVIGTSSAGFEAVIEIQSPDGLANSRGFLMNGIASFFVFECSMFKVQCSTLHDMNFFIEMPSNNP
jgi:hypothetical protein